VKKSRPSAGKQENLASGRERDRGQKVSIGGVGNGIAALMRRGFTDGIAPYTT
jgi:hypothetical protein